MAGWGYDVVGALDATPGTEELRAVAARVDRVDTGALADLARRYASLADGMESSVRAVAGRGDGVAEAWQGPGADAFARYTADFARAGSGTGDATRRIQGELADLGRTLAGLREEVAGHVSDALDLAAARPEQVRSAVAAPTARAQEALERAEVEVAECARRLRGIADGATGFSRLRSPDAGVMSASSGAGARWTDRQGATIGADEPVRAARILDGGSDDSGGSDDGGSGDGRGSRADAADPGNGGRYDTDSDAGGGDDSSDSDSGGSGSGAGGGLEGADAADASNSDSGGSGSGAGGGSEGAGGRGDSDSDSGGSGSGAGGGSEDAGAGDGSDSDSGGSGSGTGGGSEGAGAGDGSDSDSAGSGSGPDAAAKDDGGAAENGDDGSTTGTAPSSGRGGVQDWIREATAILAENGVDPDKMKADDIATIIEHESGGDPDAVNDWDSNADKGTPSKGLMQTIGPTFEANKLPGHGNITDPVDNIIAAVRYAIKRYGSVGEVPGVEAVARGDSYVGY
ncbi:transglycosylase SLT domain-containing protein [Actinomycetospora termitidis]|uniref:Transglycosylase SLT domain-containing protein n=1 Tax=Actinomycetospora termitidis TaxID=3053470 RepID=A0ABT7M337_9PSEU|nr:transglycosylase SLT domain-containing protein [Actinomycetospora sp. Odt1-22]MDL5155078.1 transglycosylase SLT domain-containing protein [Actinomycetospora sp. Odt1-22]